MRPKFTRGGEIRISRALIRRRRRGQRLLCVEVADTGIGIAPDRLESIFEPFERGDTAMTATPRAWLGAGIVRRSVEAMGGQITVASQPGQGSSFSIQLPVGTAEARRRTACRARAPRADGRA